MSLLTPEIISWIGHSEPPITVEVSRRDIVKYAIATEQARQVYLDGDEAPPMFAFGLFRPMVSLDEFGPDGLAPMGAMPHPRGRAPWGSAPRPARCRFEPGARDDGRGERHGAGPHRPPDRRAPR